MNLKVTITSLTGALTLGIAGGAFLILPVLAGENKTRCYKKYQRGDPRTFKSFRKEISLSKFRITDWREGGDGQDASKSKDGKIDLVSAYLGDFKPGKPVAKVWINFYGTAGTFHLAMESKMQYPDFYKVTGMIVPDKSRPIEAVFSIPWNNKWLVDCHNQLDGRKYDDIAIVVRRNRSEYSSYERIAPVILSRKEKFALENLEYKFHYRYSEAQIRRKDVQQELMYLNRGRLEHIYVNPGRHVIRKNEKPGLKPLTLTEPRASGPGLLTVIIPSSDLKTGRYVFTLNGKFANGKLLRHTLEFFHPGSEKVQKK